MQTVAGCPVKAPMKSPISGDVLSPSAKIYATLPTDEASYVYYMNMNISICIYSYVLHIYIYIHIVHPYPYVLRFWLLNSLALSLIVIGKKYPIPPNFKIFKATSLGKTRPGLLNVFLHESLPSSFGVWSPPTGRSTAPPPAAETVRSTGLGIRWFYWVFDDEMLKPGFRFCELFSFCGWCLKSQKCGALQSSVLTGWSFNDLKEESHSFMISAHPLAHEATQVW